MIHSQPVSSQSERAQACFCQGLRLLFRVRARLFPMLSSAGLCTTLLAAAIACSPSPREEPPSETGPAVEEITIDEIHRRMTAGRLTAVDLVDAYLARIAAYDRDGPYLNSLITLNPAARERAAELDAALRDGGELVGPLHGIPFIVKDNYDTYDLPTTAGSASLKTSIPADDAFQVRRIREAGGIVLAKSNMAEFAFSPYETVGSALPGYTRNPYDPKRVTAGSSGGTAAAVAANLGTVGLGTDTGNSIRGPSSHNLLVGIRSTMGLTSRDGIVPLYLDHDIGGPMARTVADAVAVLDVIAGTDPADPVTAESDARRPDSYLEHLVEGALEGARIGVVRQLSDTETADTRVRERFEAALADLRAAGASTVNVVIGKLDSIPRDERWCPRFRFDLEAYLAGLPDPPVRTLREIIDSGKFHPPIQRSLEFFQEIDDPPTTNEQCRRARANGDLLADGVRQVIAEHRLDALVYPTWSNPPRLIGDLTTPSGDNSQDLSPHTGFPAITVPMGLVGEGHPGLPVGITFLGVAWSEARLIQLAYSYEQVTRHRVPPTTTPPRSGPQRD